MLNVECSIEHSLETRDTIHEERAIGPFRNEPVRIVQVKAVQMRLPVEDHLDGDLSGEWILVDDVGGVFL